MTAWQRAETTVGPVAFGGRTLTLVARTTALRVGGRARGALRVRARPLHVEVLDEHGQRQIVHVRDTEQTLIAAVAIASVAGACAIRIVRRGLGERRDRNRSAP